MWVVGAYTGDMDGEAHGIVTLTPRADGSLGPGALVASTASPSFLAAAGDTLYAVSEGSGELVSFVRSGETLQETGRVDAGGSAPCHIGVYGATVVVANYTSGTLGVIATAPLALTATLDGAGSGPHAAQDGPHAHGSLELPDGRILSADLGADRLHVHSLDDGELTRLSSVEVPAGTGPRDFVLLPTGEVLVLGELSGEVLVLSRELEVTASTPIPGYEAGDHAAGISVHSDVVYTALRGSNRLAVLEYAHGALTGLGHVSCEGDWPRHHVVDGNVLHVANQLSSTIASFDLSDPRKPRLIAEPTPVASPTYLARF